MNNNIINNNSMHIIVNDFPFKQVFALMNIFKPSVAPNLLLEQVFIRCVRARVFPVFKVGRKIPNIYSHCKYYCMFNCSFENFLELFFLCVSINI